ncbi:hypothetical protein [Acidithiobacillus ferrivorans]|uniref:hypothetical protein n=1 Tax=Acidithiobacillus ferrivorans TaxID=160808 RepID=UPI0003151560|nr:hypothetical protein [Acidithiobacillus ferrivorans]
MISVTNASREHPIFRYDALDSGIMVYRRPNQASVLANPLWHAAKVAFEWRYLLHYR